ncbi:MAG: NAD-dependent deacylase [Pseudomonadota bacterium]
MGDWQANLPPARQALAAAARVAVLSGAGVSAESGVPTFRGPGGLWEKHRPEDLATPQAFRRDPALVWRWYHWRRELIAACAPNPAHQALAAYEARRPGFTLITQNVDGLHRLAGSRNLLEIHGSLWRVRCLDCGVDREERRLDLPAPPLCPACGGLLRPDVVWFGESLDQDLLDRAWRAAGNCQAMLVVGTSAVVQPAASLALVAKSAGAYVIEVNPDPTPNTGRVDVSLHAPAGEVLPALLAP